MNIHEIIARYLSGSASHEETLQLEEWRNNEGNEQLFQEYKKTWEVSGNTNRRIYPDPEAAWEKFSERKKERRTGRKNALYFLAAAAVIIPVGLFIFFFNNSQTISTISASVPFQKKQIEMEEVFSADSVVVMYLPDSSRVWLNRNSRISYSKDFTADIRTINLRGEAFFEVRHIESKPFIIYTERSVTKVLGTSFNLKAYDSTQVEITVVSGQVEFAPSGNEQLGKQLLLAEDKGVINAQKKEVIKSKNKDSSYAWWKATRMQNKFKKFLSRIKKAFKNQ